MRVLELNSTDKHLSGKRGHCKTLKRAHRTLKPETGALSVTQDVTTTWAVGAVPRGPGLTSDLTEDEGRVGSLLRTSVPRSSGPGGYDGHLALGGSVWPGRSCRQAVLTADRRRGAQTRPRGGPRAPCLGPGVRRRPRTAHAARNETLRAPHGRVLLLQRGRHPRLDPELPRGPLPGAPVTAQARGPVRLRLLTADARHRGPKGHLGDSGTLRGRPPWGPGRRGRLASPPGCVRAAPWPKRWLALDAMPRSWNAEGWGPQKSHR